MSDTKERILHTALEHFAREGYAASSMRDIAAQLGITKGALYRHYPSKRAILEAMVERMEQRDRENARAHELPEEALPDAPEAYGRAAPENIRTYALEMFRYWTEDPFAAAFRRMLALERYRDPEMAALYGQYLSTGPLLYMEDLFREMMEAGCLRRGDARAMALEFYGPMYLLMDARDGKGQASSVAELENCIDRFFAANRI